LAELEEERRRLSQESEKAQRAAEQARAARATVEAEQMELERRRGSEDLQHHQRLKTELDQAAAEIRELLGALRSERSLEAATRAQNQVGAKVKEVEQRIQEDRERLGALQPPETPAEVKIGSWVRHPSLEADVEVVDLVGDEAVIAAGALKMRVPVSQLRAARGKKPKPRFARVESEQSLHRAQQAAAASWSGSEKRCDVRGLRLEDALREVDQFLDRLLRSGEESAVIVHGHGTGALKQGIRDALASSPYVRLYRPGEGHEGGDGVTIVAVRH
jgi:DNA mismatch repair protein MutS2